MKRIDYVKPICQTKDSKEKIGPWIRLLDFTDANMNKRLKSFWTLVGAKCVLMKGTLKYERDYNGIWIL